MRSKVAFVVLVSLTVLFVETAVAQAATSACSAYYGVSSTRTCVQVRDGNGNTVGNLSGQFYNYTLAVLQCDGSGSNCGVFASTSSSSFTNTTYVATSNPYSFGHTYFSRASWNDTQSGTQYVNAVTALVCCP